MRLASATNLQDFHFVSCWHAKGTHKIACHFVSCWHAKGTHKIACPNFFVVADPKSFLKPIS